MKNLLFYILLNLILLLLSFEDIKELKVDNLLILILSSLSIFTKVNIKERLIGLVIPFVLIPFFGIGDIYIFASLGFIFGYQDVTKVFIYSSLASGIINSILLLCKIKKANEYIAYVPYIYIGLLIKQIIK